MPAQGNRQWQLRLDRSPGRWPARPRQDNHTSPAVAWWESREPEMEAAALRQALTLTERIRETQRAASTPSCLRRELSFAHWRGLRRSIGAIGPRRSVRIGFRLL